MANPWDNDPVVKSGKNPWDNDPVVGASPAPAEQKKPEQSFLKKASNVFGVADAALNMGTGLIAKPLSDIAGLAATGKEMISPTPGGGDPAAFKRHVQEGLTYEPRTDLGKVVAEYNPLALIGKGVGKVADMAGNAVAGDKPGMVRDAAGNFVREGIQQGVGFIAPALKKPLAARLASEEASLAAEKAANAQRDANVAAAREKGYVLPPSVAGVKGPLSSFFQAEAGSTKLDYGASYKNQRVTNKLIKEEMGLTGDEAISAKSLAEVREKAGNAYKDVKAAVPTLKVTPEFKAALQNPNSKFAKARAEFPEYFKNAEIEKLVKDLNKAEFSSEAAIEMQKVLRSDGYANLKAFDKPKQQALGEAQINASKAIDALIDQNLNLKAPPGVKNFQSKLATNLAQARKKIAQSYAVEGALNDATGNVSAKALAKLWEKDGTLTGGLKDVAQTHQAFEKQLRDVDKLPATATENISNMDVAKGAMLAGLGHGAIGAVSTLGRAAVKPALLSDWYQAMNVKPPTYKPGLAYTLPVDIANNPGWGFGIPKPPPQQEK
jgi:hypothetical protein